MEARGAPISRAAEPRGEKMGPRQNRRNPLIIHPFFYLSMNPHSGGLGVAFCLTSILKPAWLGCTCQGYEPCQYRPQGHRGTQASLPHQGSNTGEVTHPPTHPSSIFLPTRVVRYGQKIKSRFFFSENSIFDYDFDFSVKE